MVAFFGLDQNGLMVMTKKQEIQLFEEKKIRTVWDDVAERWYFSIVDVVSVLTESKDPALSIEQAIADYRRLERPSYLHSFSRSIIFEKMVCYERRR